MPHDTLVPERGGNLLSNLAKYQLFSPAHDDRLIDCCTRLRISFSSATIGYDKSTGKSVY